MDWDCFFILTKDFSIPEQSSYLPIPLEHAEITPISWMFVSQQL